MRSFFKLQVIFLLLNIPPICLDQFYHPSGLGAYVNRSLDDASFMLYIADRGNHVIRGMSAACSFSCENNGRCVGPNKCECLHGWSGIDCTKPLCQNSCGQRELCVAPNTCACIPGYDGAGCLAAKCSQQCVNGHCSAPDVCTCNPGWFDSNCVSSTEFCVFQFIFQAANNHSSSLDSTCRRRPCVNRHVEIEVRLAFTA